MGITGVTTYVIKMPRSPTTIFVSFNFRLMDPKPLFKIKYRAYILLFIIATFYQIYNIKYLTKYFLPVTVQVNMFSKTTLFLQMSQILQLTMLLLLLLFLLG